MEEKMKFRNFICTINFANNQDNHMQFLPDFTKVNGIKRVTVQLERASLIHWQMFVEQTFPSTAKALANRVFKATQIRMHVSIPKKINGRWPTAKQGIEYVTKEDTYYGQRHIFLAGRGIHKPGWYGGYGLFTVPEFPKPLPKRVHWDNGPTDENIKQQLRLNIAQANAYLRGQMVSAHEDFRECQDGLDYLADIELEDKRVDKLPDPEQTENGSKMASKII